VRSEVQIFPGPPISESAAIKAASDGALQRALLFRCSLKGAIAQLGERLLCKQEVVGSIPSGSTRGKIDARFLQFVRE
jgi:hypothetical protein